MSHGALFVLFATITQLGTLSIPRAGHTASLLRDGTVVVMGGTNELAIEVIDPRSRTHSVDVIPSALRVPLHDHAATVLEDDQILLTGGFFTGDRTTCCWTWGNSRADLFDGGRSEVLPLGHMATARMDHQATRLIDGRVLITGGSVFTKQGYFVEMIPTDHAEIFDPLTGAFRPVGSMRTARYGHTATLLQDGRVLIAGGSPYVRPYASEAPPPLVSTEIFDPRTETFEAGPDLLATHAGHTATLLDDGRVVIVDKTTEIFDPATNTVSAGPDIGARSGHTATRMPDGRVLFFGGANDAVLYDFRTEKVADRTPLEIARTAHTATLLRDGTVLIVGGRPNGSASADILRYALPVPRRRAVTSP
jgi:galactose oxidase-like protein